MGEHDLADEFDGAEPVEYNVVDRIIHSEYHPRTFDNDIALLTLDRDVEYNDFIHPICLPLHHEEVQKRTFGGRSAVVAGWGATRFRGPTSNVLQYVFLDASFNEFAISRSTQ